VLKQKEDQIPGNNTVLTDRRQPSFLYKIQLLYAKIRDNVGRWPPTTNRLGGIGHSISNFILNE